MKMHILQKFYILIGFAIITHHIQAQQKSKNSILLLIDCSGSMMGVKMDSVKSAARQIISMLLPCNTEFAIMGFTGDKVNPVPYKLEFNTDKTRLFSFIDGLKPWGGTRIGAALTISTNYFADYVKTHKTNRKTIFLLSDGLSDDDALAALRDLKAKKRAFQTECIGYDLLKDKKAEDQLKQMAFESGGEYYSAVGVSNVAKAFFKTSIKTIIHEVPVQVRRVSKPFNFKLNTTDVYKKLTSQNWFLDSVQINVSDSLFAFTQLLTEENMQDTMPKSLVFDNAKRVSLFIDKATGTQEYQKWVEGNFVFSNNTLSITILQYYFKLVIKYIDKRSLVLCVNKFAYTADTTREPDDMLCDCSNRITNDNPHILVYFSKAGCN